MASLGTTAAVLVLAAFALNDCTEKRYITNQLATDSAHIRGIVRAWRCGVGDVRNNRFGPWRLRFSVNTGEPAQVTFIRDNGFTSIVETNDSSEFDLYLSAGAHKIAVETGYTYPADTFFNVQLKPGDTTLVLDIVYAVLDPLNIECTFSYLSIDDTLSTKTEWDAILELNQRTTHVGKGFPVFEIDWTTSPSDLRQFHRSDFTRRVYVYYQLPIHRKYPGGGRLYNVLEAYELLDSLLSKDSTGAFPQGFYVSPSGAYGCLDAASDGLQLRLHDGVSGRR